MSKEPKSFADTLPPFLRRSCSAVSGDGGFRFWLDAKFGAGKWALCEYPRGDIERAISNHELGDLAVEYGYQRLSAIFASLDPVATASELSRPHGKSPVSAPGGTA
jgi:hypothetical protein